MDDGEEEEVTRKRGRDEDEGEEVTRKKVLTERERYAAELRGFENQARGEEWQLDITKVKKK